MTLDPPILSAQQRADLAELALRMKRDEPGLYVRQVGPVLIVRLDKGLRLQRERIKALVTRGKFQLWKKTKTLAFLQEVRK